jgi:hypothetical protein
MSQKLNDLSGGLEVFLEYGSPPCKSINNAMGDIFFKLSIIQIIDHKTV